MVPLQPSRGITQWLRHYKVRRYLPFRCHVGPQAEPDRLGLHIYMAGVGLQQLFILVFTAFTVQLHRSLLRAQVLDTQPRKNVLQLIYVVYAVLFLITVCPLFLSHPF